MDRLFFAVFALSISVSVAAAEDAMQDIRLNVGNLSATVTVPASWGEYYPINPESAPSAEVAIPVMDGIPFATAAWNKVVPKIELEGYEPSITITLVDLSSAFQDDPEANLPAEEISNGKRSILPEAPSFFGAEVHRIER